MASNDDMIGDFLDPLGLFHTTSSEKRKQSIEDANLELAKRNMQLQEDAFDYQKGYDTWAKGLAERNFQLQSSPVSSLVADAQKVGVNPMAAMGQSVGSASAGSSSVSNPSPVGPVPYSPDIRGQVLSAITSAMNSRASLDVQERMADKSNNLKYQELSVMERLRNRELDIAQEDADTRKGHLTLDTSEQNLRYNHLEKVYQLDRSKFDLEVQKRLDTVLQNARQDSQFWAAHRADLEKIKHAKEQLKYDQVRDDKDRREKYVRDIVLGVSALGSVASDIFKFMQFGGALPF